MKLVRETGTREVAVKYRWWKYNAYYAKVEKKQNIIPNVKGMSGMDAVALLENLGLKVKAVGTGKVKTQSLQAGQNIEKNSSILLKLS